MQLLFDSDDGVSVVVEWFGTGPAQLKSEASSHAGPHFGGVVRG